MSLNMGAGLNGWLLLSFIYSIKLLSLKLQRLQVQVNWNSIFHVNDLIIKGFRVIRLY